MIPVNVTPEEYQAWESGEWEVPEILRHNSYPHVPGYLHGCVVCESQCFCDDDVRDGRASQCIYCDESEALATHYDHAAWYDQNS